MLRTVIIDDEKKGRETLTNLVKENCQNVEIAATAGSKDEGIAAINQHKPDFIFLDIEMPGGSGFKLLKELDDVKPPVIFVTAYDHYAIKAIKFSALDYILKPVDADELRNAVSRVGYTYQNLGEEQVEVLLNYLKEPSRAKRIALPTQSGIRYVGVPEIVRCEADGQYTTFYLNEDSNIMVSKNLKEYQDILEESSFYRVHHSHLVNLEHVKEFARSEGDYLIMKDGSNIPVSRRKKEGFLQSMQDFGK
ncbi:MAG: response regulator transcription factor [Bacteroidetes bacterium]|nr:response regulator transcription factor [Bacteroidota bacterium]